MLLLAKPTVSFELCPGDGINIDAMLSWPIVRYGLCFRCDITLLETGLDWPLVRVMGKID
ncbi:hypothetical protein [Sodalis-like endosymbiont of Proechinophthirus fluctus]|uniref:hypothetical protein n=1 Tax=Sodalis-like endosymbiont of Proechinophthirus fluctus TaxID=1462730 RepID=UPI00164F208F|nr:hypothetical protein [Sodalis-like endosymbiont of Proechinophthirus fluctus]